MQGFKLFLENTSVDVSSLCAKIMENKDGVLNFNILADLLDDLDNKPKADYIRKLLELNTDYLESGNILSHKALALLVLAYSGRKGFCTPLGIENYEAWESGEKTPSVGFRITLQEIDRVPLYQNQPTFIMGKCPFTNSVCQTAANKQMGVGQSLNENFNASQFNFAEIEINHAHTWPDEPGEYSQVIHDTRYLRNEQVLMGVEERIRQCINDGMLQCLDSKFENRKFYTTIYNDLESYSQLTFLLRQAGVANA